MTLSPSDIARFWDKVETDGSGCWLWTGGCNRPGGYGRFRVGKKMVVAHRVAWELAYGPIPEGKRVLHHCDTPPCENPAHLWLGTQADNLQDCRDKGRRPRRYMKEPKT